MEIKDYGSNSLRSKGLLPSTKEEKPQHQKKIVSGTVVKKKESVGHKLADVFMPEDVSDVKDFVVWDVLLPSIRNAIGDSLMSAVGTMFPRTDVKRNYTQGSNVSYVSYRNSSKPAVSANPRQSYSYDSIILSTRGEAEQVLQSLNDIIEQYGLASVSDLYDLVGIQGSYTDNKFGWTDLRKATADRVREGYLLRLPKALPLD